MISKLTKPAKNGFMGEVFASVVSFGPSRRGSVHGTASNGIRVLGGRGEALLDSRTVDQSNQPSTETTSTIKTKPATSSTMPWRIIAVIGTWPEL